MANVTTSLGRYEDVAAQYAAKGWRELSSPYAPSVIDREWAMASGAAASRQDCSLCGHHGLYWRAFAAPADHPEPLGVVAYCGKCRETIDWSWWQEPLA